MPSPLDDYRIAEEPFYRPAGGEVALYERAYAHRMPLILKGPTGCGKTRFVEYMAWKLGRPLVTLACNEDMTASDLIGRYLLDAGGTAWHDGPLTQAVRHGGICYLDEVVEARQDTTVVIHPLTDARRVLPLDKKGELVRASRLPAGGVVQPGLPEQRQGHEGLDAAALRRAGVRLSRAGAGGRDRGP